MPVRNSVSLRVQKEGRNYIWLYPYAAMIADGNNKLSSKCEWYQKTA